MRTNWAIDVAALDGEWCDRVISTWNNPKKASVGDPGKGEVLKDSRDAEVTDLVRGDRKSAFIFDEMDRRIAIENNKWFDFLLNSVSLTYLQLIRYRDGGHYVTHIDSFLGKAEEGGTHDRKISFTVQLTDGGEYEGGDLSFPLLGPVPDPSELRERGTILWFPSFMPHGVAPVTRGVRHALVGWVYGPAWR